MSTGKKEDREKLTQYMHLSEEELVSLNHLNQRTPLPPPPPAPLAVSCVRYCSFHLHLSPSIHLKKCGHIVRKYISYNVPSDLYPVFSNHCCAANIQVMLPQENLYYFKSMTNFNSSTGAKTEKVLMQVFMLLKLISQET